MQEKYAVLFLHDSLLRITDYRLQIITAAGCVRRVNDTIHILKDGRTQEYMQECATRIYQEDAGSDDFKNPSILKRNSDFFV